MSEDNIERQMHSDMYKHYPPSLKIISNNTYKMNPENKPIGEKIQKNILNNFRLGLLPNLHDILCL